MARTIPIRSISDDDVCSDCGHCTPVGGGHTCALGWPGARDEDGYVTECPQHDSYRDRAARKCGFAHPGTYGHECGRPAVVAGARPSDLTTSGTFWAARCAECQGYHGGENAGITQWEPLDLTRHRNQFKR